MSVFKGAAVAIVTPFTEDGSAINYEAFAQIIDDQIAGGTDAIVVCGSTGEAATMTEEEHLEAVKFVIDYVNHRVPVIAGTGSNCTRTAIHLSKEAASYGADALLVVSPYYNKATQDGLYQHYKAIADSVKTPIILYNVPSRTGCNILPETVARLVRDVDNIVGIKEASGNISQIVKLMKVTDGNVELYSGNDDQTVPILSMGGLGVISVVSNIAPAAVHEMCAKFFAGDVAGAAAMQCGMLDLCDNLFSEVNPIPVKKAMNLQGKNVGPLRMPLTEMEPAHAKVLEDAMRAYGLLN